MIYSDKLFNYPHNIFMKRLRMFLASALLTLVALPLQAGTSDVYTKELIVNGNFDDEFTAWTGSKVDADSNIETQLPLDGNYSTFGSLGETESISQIITVPKDAGRVTLSFYYRFYTNDNSEADYALFGVLGETRAEDYTLVRYSTAGDQADWTYTSIDMSQYAGDTVQIVFGTINNDASLTFADFDSISVTAESNGVLKGTVLKSNGKALRQANVRITDNKDNLIWKGKTNDKGKFSASLSGSDKKYQVKISKDGESVKKKVLISWAETTKQAFEF